jgi:transposase-like protein/IS1 family transposase
MEYRLIRFKGGLNCPYCNGTRIVLWGKRKGIQRYRCKDCGKHFNDLTGTPMAWSKKPEKWPQMTEALQKSLTLEQTAIELDISISTAFRWRHHLLKGLGVCHQNIQLSGIIEVDETLFRISEKGSRNLSRKPRKRGRGVLRGRSKDQVYAVIARDRTRQTRSYLLRQMSGKSLIAELGASFPKDSQLCTDAWRSYQTFARKLDLKHIRLNMKKGRRVVHGIYHIQSVNSYHSRLKIWSRNVRGVATKYLPNYLYWFEHVDTSRKLQKGLGGQLLFFDSLNACRDLSHAA